MPFKTELTEKLGIAVPVVQGGMQWVGYAELASAVSNAGGLGILTSLTQPSPDDLRKEIRKCRTMTKKRKEQLLWSIWPWHHIEYILTQPVAFGVNITLLPSINPPDYPGYAQAIIDEGIKIVETAGNSPGPIIKKLKAAGCIILHKCGHTLNDRQGWIANRMTGTTIRHAISAVKLGVDFLSIDGFECAGHIGETDITNFILLNRARQVLKVPFIASGGMADGYSLAAALSLGASGINCGTRFMCTIESPIHNNIKEAIVNATENDTKILMRKFKNSSRLYANKVANEAYVIENDPQTTEFKSIQPYMSGQRGRKVFTEGDVDAGVWTAGQVIGLINDIPTCEDLVKRIEREAEESIAKSNSMIVSHSKL